jgi:hypothetical protein
MSFQKTDTVYWWEVEGKWSRLRNLVRIVIRWFLVFVGGFLAHSALRAIIRRNIARKVGKAADEAWRLAIDPDTWLQQMTDFPSQEKGNDR